MADQLTPEQMQEIEKTRSKLADAKARRAKTQAARNAARVKEAMASDSSVFLTAARASRDQIAVAARALTAATTARRQIDEDISWIDREIGDLQERLTDIFEVLRDPASTLDGRFPVALFPVRLETRFVGAALKVRVYPDVAQIYQFEEQLTDDEEDHGHAYWRQRWADENPALAWETVVNGRNVNRVAWIVEATTPENLEELGSGEPKFPELTKRPKGPSEAARAELLPARWLVAGYRNGAEVFRKAGMTIRKPLPVSLAPDPGEPLSAVDDPLDDPAADTQAEITMNDEARWLVDFDAAKDAGMALEITAADDGNLRQGYDRLVVLGVEHRQDPRAGADEIARVFEGHHFGRGLGFVAPGTPTNATEDETVHPRPVARDPASTVKSGGDAEAVRAALGLDDDSILLSVDGSDTDRFALAGSMTAALWEPTMGYFLREIMKPMIKDNDAARIRAHAVANLRPAGPLPTLRIGDQPMGLLPVTKLADYAPSAENRAVSAALKAMWPFWAYSARSALQLGDSGDPTADMVELLQRTNRSTVWRLREAFGPIATANSTHSLGGAPFQEFSAMLTLALLGALGQRPFIVDMTIAEESRPSPIPLVTGDPLGATPLAPNYIAQVLARVARAGGPKQLKSDASKASTLLEALLIRAAELELARAGVGLVLGELDLDIEIGEALTDREYHVAKIALNPDAVQLTEAAVEVAADGAKSLSVPAAALGNARLQTLTGNRTVLDHVASLNLTDLARTLPGLQLAEFRQALAALRDQPTALLDALAADTLDGMAYRYDAWVTSLATRRLSEGRRSRPRGIHVGGYGWVEDLRPRNRPPSSGLVHAPSIPQATTAAILRSGHLARNDAAADPLSIDLSSKPVREATRLLEGMRRGQSLAALLGYRWERKLRDFGVDFAVYILPTRQAFPLPETRDRETSGPVESIAARNVADGVALAELDRDGRRALFADVGVIGRHRSAVGFLLDELRAVLDAVGDLLMAEGVYQAVLGNSERAAAALDTLDKQTPPPEIGITRTPRSGHRISHRVLVLLDEDRPPAEWRRMDDVRSRAAPHVNAWIARLLGDPARLRFDADHVAEDGTVSQTVTVDATALDISALSLVLSASSEEGAVSEFEQRLQVALLDAAPLADGDRLRARPRPPPGDTGAVGLGEFLATARAIADLLSSARAADARDLTHPTEAVDPTPDAAEIAARADDAEAELRRIANEDPKGLSSLRARDLRRLLTRAAALGLPGAVVIGTDRAVEEARAREVIGLAVSRVAALPAPPAATGARPETAFHIHRLQAIFGANFPAIPVETLPQQAADTLSGPMGDPAMLDGDSLAPTEWLSRHAPVRPAIERLWQVLSGAEARGTRQGDADLSVSQLPHTAGTPWVGRPEAFQGKAPPETDASFVIHRASGGSGALGPRIAALSVEQWSELVPSTKETSGISFQFDGPGARAPQTVLLAVHPARTKPQWSTDMLLDILGETASLTRMRTLDLDDVASAGRFLPAAYLAFDIEDNVPSLDWVKVFAEARLNWELQEFFQ